MNIITRIFALFIVSIPIILLCLVAHFFSTVFGLTGILYYLPHLFIITSCIYYIKTELRKYNV